MIVQPGHATVTRLAAGERVRIVDIEGAQICDVIGLSVQGAEWISPPETILMNYSFTVKPGQAYYTNTQRPGLKLLRDDSNGIQDLTNACCNKEFYEKWGHGSGHLNCRDAFTAAFSKVGIDRWDFATPINLFQVTEMGHDGESLERPADTKPGTTVELEAMIDLWLGVSSCPYEFDDRGGSVRGAKATPILVEVIDA